MEKMKHKGIELVVEIKPYSNKEKKMVIEFDLKGTHYQNAQMLPVNHSESEAVVALDALTKWAKTVINENIKS